MLTTMAQMKHKLNNINLDETYPSASSYNGLPHIDNMRDVATAHVGANAELLKLIKLHGVAHIFSIHLIHKHYDLPQDRVMVYETIRAPNHQDFVLCSPRKSIDIPTSRGLYFRATKDGRMAAYEFTTDPCQDLSSFTGFVAKFNQAVLDLGLESIFGLTVLGIGQGKKLTEFELTDLLSTVLVSDANFLPGSNAIPTNWLATDTGLEGFVDLFCTESRHDGHRVSIGWDGEPFDNNKDNTSYQEGLALKDDRLMIGDHPIAKGSHAFAILNHARARTQVC